MSQVVKLARLAAIEGLPREMQDHALVPWDVATVLIGGKDIEHARATIIAAGVPLTHVSERRKLPTWGALRAFIRERTVAPA